jgi:hypothetical protein
MFLRIIVAVAVSLATAAARAQDKPAAPPGSAPDGQDAPAAAAPPNAAPADADAPADEPAPPRPAPAQAVRESLKALARALQDGKAAGIRQVIYAANPTERKMVDAMAAMAAELAALHKAAVKAFGEEDARALTGDVAAEMKRIDEAEVSIDGDTATVRYKPDPAEAPAESSDAGAVPAAPAEGEPSPPPPPPMVMKRIAGRWQVPMSELSRDATPEGIEQRLADLEAQTKVIVELTKEIAKGKYRNADKATEAWQSKMMQALTPGSNKPPAEEKPGEKRAEKPDEKSDEKPEGERPKDDGKESTDAAPPEPETPSDADDESR